MAEPRPELRRLRRFPRNGIPLMTHTIGSAPSVADQFSGSRFTPYSGRGQRLAASSPRAGQARGEELGGLDLGGAGDVTTVEASSPEAASAASSSEAVRAPDEAYRDQLLPDLRHIDHMWAREACENLDFIRKDLDRIEAVHEIFAGWLFDIDETDPVNDKVRSTIVDWLATLTIWKTHFQSILSDVMENYINHDLADTMNDLWARANEADSAYNTWKPKVKPYLRDEPVDYERSLKRRKTDEDVYAEVVPPDLEHQLFGNTDVD